MSPTATWRPTNFSGNSKLVGKVLNLRTDSNHVKDVSDFRRGEKDFHNSFTFGRREPVFETLHSAMWISDYRLVDFSAPPPRVTLADKTGPTKNVAVKEGVLRESSAMTSRYALSCHHVTFRTRARAANDRSMRRVRDSRWRPCAMIHCTAHADIAWAVVGHVVSQVDRAFIPLRVDDNQR